MENLKELAQRVLNSDNAVQKFWDQSETVEVQLLWKWDRNNGQKTKPESRFLQTLDQQKKIGHGGILLERCGKLNNFLERMTMFAKIPFCVHLPHHSLSLKTARSWQIPVASPVLVVWLLTRLNGCILRPHGNHKFPLFYYHDLPWNSRLWGAALRIGLESRTNWKAKLIEPFLYQWIQCHQSENAS